MEAKVKFGEDCKCIRPDSCDSASKVSLLDPLYPEKDLDDPEYFWGSSKCERKLLISSHKSFDMKDASLFEP